MKYSKVNFGQIEALLNKIGGEDAMMAILQGKAAIVHKEHSVDLKKDPFIPWEDFSVKMHIQNENFVWDLEKIQLKCEENPYCGTVDFQEISKRKDLLNANMLDYLLENQHLIPKDWKIGFFFWGTIYHLDKDNGKHWGKGTLIVRTMDFVEGHWQQGYEIVGKEEVVARYAWTRFLVVE